MWILIFYIEKFCGSAACLFFRIVEFSLRDAELVGFLLLAWVVSVG
jgi:hypothetical protein